MSGTHIAHQPLSCDVSDPMHSTKRAKTSPKSTFGSPSCVSMLATESSFNPSELNLDDSAKPGVRNTESHFELPHRCWWQELMRLRGKRLIDRLDQIKLDEMIDYHGGLLNEDFTTAIVNLYNHVAEQGDDPKTTVYSADSVENMKLPFWIPPVDDEGFSRKERLLMAVEYDVWQWYLVTNENFSLLDTLVWMGVQMKNKLEDRMRVAGEPSPPWVIDDDK